MFGKKDYQKINLMGVAIAIIIVGAAIFAFGIVAWLLNIAAAETRTAMPSAKIIGGAVLMALGYIQLEIELFRHK
jgi:uncharacterized membrane protein YidH (DUF202 family)